MDIYEYAKKMELDGKALYQRQLATASNAGLKAVLAMLVEQEDKHFQILQALQQHHPVPQTHASFKGVRTLFEEMQDEPIAHDQKKLYEQILHNEKRSHQFYLEKSQGLQGKERDILLRLADEEQKHVTLIQNIIQMIEQPQQWVEDAEFNHLDDY